MIKNIKLYIKGGNSVRDTSSFEEQKISKTERNLILIEKKFQCMKVKHRTQMVLYIALI